jgi:hypothetical protein
MTMAGALQVYCVAYKHIYGGNCKILIIWSVSCFALIIYWDSGALMQEVAQGTFTYEHFPEVMSMLWKRMLQDNKKNWRRTYKVI